MRPSRVDTSEPACTNRKMLSTKSSTSWFCTSRKYSAIVRADSATRRRTPGGSSIWPNTRAAFSSTPDSAISMRRSVPSRVRSPTPANTDTPPCCWATRRIISVMSTVLPTPAPPNRPILPPGQVRGEQVDDLDPGLEHPLGRLELVEGRGVAVDLPALEAVGVVGVDVERRAPRVPDVAEHLGADRDGDALPGVAHRGPPGQAVGRLHADRPHAAPAELLCHLGQHRHLLPVDVHRELDRHVDLGERARGTRRRPPARRSRRRVLPSGRGRIRSWSWSDSLGVQ